jgi:hypothetical protein
VEHLNALGQLNQALDLEPPRLKRNKPAAPETDETAA